MSKAAIIVANQICATDQVIGDGNTGGTRQGMGRQAEIYSGDARASRVLSREAEAVCR